MTSFIIEHQCPQCGAPAELEETDRLFKCEFCRVGSYLDVPDVFRYTLPHKAPSGKELIYFPYWRFKGMLFTCVPGNIENRYVDISQQAIATPHVPFSLGFRSQTQKLKFAGIDSEGVFLKPELTRADMLTNLTARFNATIRKTILHQAEIGETISLLYAPFYLDSRLKDAILSKAVSNATPEELIPLMKDTVPPNWPLRFIPTICPACGWDLAGLKDALALACTNCNTMWWARGGKLKQLKVAHVSNEAADAVYMPFWRIQAEISGINLHSYTDLIREANQPKVPQDGWDKIPFYFWTPAFKVRPQSFLTFASQVTSYQPREDLIPGQPKSRMHGINLPLQEGVESLNLILASFIKPRKRIEDALPTLKIKARRVLLVYLPFEEGPHEMVHGKMNIGINKNLLAHAKNL